MRKTIVGFFRSTTEAQTVKHELVNEGYAASDIRVLANDSMESGSLDTAHTDSTAADTGIAAKIGNFFRSLTGADQDSDHYVQGVSKGGAILSVTVADDQQERVISLLESHGATDIEDQNAGSTHAAGLAAAGTTAGSAVGTHAASMTGSTATANLAAEGSAIPVVQEEVQVGKRQVQRGGVRVYSHLVETPVQENVQLREEHVHVARQNVNRPASEADFSAFKEGTIELTETAEEAVVSKHARVVEEIVVGKEATERTETIHDTVRHTEVEVEEIPGEPRSTAGGAYKTTTNTFNK